MGHGRGCQGACQVRWAGVGLLWALSLAACAPLDQPAIDPAPAAAPTHTARRPTPSATASPYPPTPTTAGQAAEATATWTVDCVEPRDMSLSPDEGWAAFDCQTTISRFDVVDRSGVVWSLGGEPASSNQHLARRAEFWSADGRYLFFSQTLRKASGSATAESTGSLYRLTLTSGDIVPVLVSVNDAPAYVFAVDPAGQRLAWLLVDSPDVLTLLDLISYATQRVNLDSKLSSIDEPTWSPDGGLLALTGVRSGRGVLITFDPATNAVVTLPTPDDRAMHILDWPIDGPLTLQDDDWPSPGTWTLNLVSGAFLRSVVEAGP